MITPFTAREEIDEDDLRETIRFLIKCGVHGIMCNGSTGEAASLLKEERKKVVQVTVDEAKGKLPVIAGTGVSGTRETIRLTEDARDAGADAAMIVTPFYLIPNPEGVYAHYKRITESIDFPIVLYNIPPHTKTNIDPELLGKLAKLKNIVGIKDSSGNLGQFAEFIKNAGDKIAVLNGCDDLLFPAFMLGAPGAIVAVGNIAPELAVNIYNSYLKGEFQECKKLNERLLPIARAISVERNFPAQVKEAIAILGRPSGPPRKPIVPLTGEEKEEIRKALVASELL